MSTDSYELFNVWFPALVCGLIIGLLAAALWDVLRRKTWLFASRFWPGVLKEVGLDNSSPSRRELKGDLREVTEKLSDLASQISFLVPVKSSMAESTDSAAAESSNSNSPVSSNCAVTYHSDIEAQPIINPLSSPTGKPITFTATAYFPDDTPVVVIRSVKKSFKKHSKGTVKRWKSSIVLQASLPIEACVLAEIGELAKSCMQVENRCTFQLAHWAILYYNAGEVHVHILKEGDVPVNVEARWQAKQTGITMRGLYLNGAQVKVATKRSSTILRSAGPATQGPGDLDELHFAIGERDVPGEDSLINAAKIVEADGISLIVRSEASFILRSREKFSLIEAIWGRLQRISLSAKEMINIFLKDEDRQPETTDNRPELRSDDEHLELIVEHWKGVSEIELLDYRKEVLQYLQEPQASGIVGGAGSQRPYPQINYMRDGRYMEYWQRGLQELNEVHLLSIGGPQSGTHISIRGGIKFLLGDFENALHDFDLAYLNMGGQRSTVLLDRAFVKCMLARYSEAIEDVVAIISITPNVNDIQELQTCIQQILHLQGSFRIVESGPLCPRPELCDLDNSRVKIPDLLTGGEWHSGQSEAFRNVSDDSTAAESVDVAQAADVHIPFIADTTLLKLQLKLTNYAQTLESKPRYHVRRISFVISILNDECGTDDDVKLLSAEDQDVLSWQARTEDLQDDVGLRNNLIYLSGRLCPYKNISLSLFDKVTDDDTHQQRLGPHPLISYRNASFRSVALTKHSATLGQVQLLYSYDGLSADRSRLRWRCHDYVKLVLTEATPSYRVFWLVQWDIEEMLDPISDGQGDLTWRSCLDYPELERQDDLEKFHGIRRTERRKSPWIAEVRPKGLKRREKIWLGTYKTPEAAARAADAGFHYYNLNRFNFQDSSSFLKQIPRYLDGKDKVDFVQKEAHRLASLTEMPSSAWIPEYRSYNTSAEEVTSSEPWDIDCGCEVTSAGTRNLDQLRKRMKIEPRLRHGFKRFTMEVRPPRFKKKLWFGTYTAEEIDRARDAVNYYMGCNLPYSHLDSPLIFASKPLKGIQFASLRPSCDDFIQVGDGQELKYKYFARQVKDVIHSVLGKQMKSSNKYNVPHTEAPQKLDLCGPTMPSGPVSTTSSGTQEHSIRLPVIQIFNISLRVIPVLMQIHSRVHSF